MNIDMLRYLHFKLNYIQFSFTFRFPIINQVMKMKSFNSVIGILSLSLNLSCCMLVSGARLRASTSTAMDIE